MYEGQGGVGVWWRGKMGEEWRTSVIVSTIKKLKREKMDLKRHSPEII